ATDGSLDGGFELRITADDNDPTSGTLVRAVNYYYDTRRPDTLSVSADSGQVRVVLADSPGGSGIDLLNSSMRVMFGGQPLQDVRYINDGDSTLIAEFDPPLRAVGSYTIAIVATDLAGNSRSRTRSFFISGGIRLVSVIPADGAIVSRSMAETRKVARITIEDRSGTGIDSSATYISLLDPEDRVMNGISKVDSSGEVSFTLSNFLTTDGSSDGRYTMQFNADDKAPSTDPLFAEFTFLYDTQAPDTLSVKTFGETGGQSIDSVVVRFTDNRLTGSREYSDLDINAGLTYLNLLSPSGNPLAGSTTLLKDMDDIYRLTRHFEPPLTSRGTYTVKMVMEDQAGNKRERLKPIELGVDRPEIISVAPVAASFLNAGVQQPVVVSVDIRDWSGSGIDLAASWVKVLGPRLQSVAGSSKNMAGEVTTLSFSFDELLSTDGTDDGTYWVIVHAVDYSPLSADLDTTLYFTYDTSLPDTLGVDADSARVTVRLADRAPGSGIDLLSSSIEVFAVDSTPVQGVRYTNDGDSTLFATFDPLLTVPGIYTVVIEAVDRAGNARNRSAFFSVGSALVGVPTLISVSPPLDLGEPKNAAGITQPLVVGVQVQDNSGAGIDWANSSITLTGPDSAVIAGEVTQQENALALIVGSVLSNSGADDGLYTMRVHIRDLSPASADLDTSFSFIYDNLPPDTVSVSFAPDSSSITVILADLAAGLGRLNSGLDILSVQATVTGPGGLVSTGLTHDGQSSVTITFTEGKPGEAGIFKATVWARDHAGNSMQTAFRFSLNIAGTMVFYPPDSSLVRGPLTRVTALVQGRTAVLAPGAEAVMRLTHQGLAVMGTSLVVGDTLIFQLADTLPEDGRADGLYRVIAEMDLPELGEDSSVDIFFTVDNLPPDTVSVEVQQSVDGVLVRARFTDSGSWPDVAGIDRQATRLVITAPDGRRYLPKDTLWVDENTLEAGFGTLEAAGRHDLELVVADRAGWSVTRLKTLVNSFGLTQGGSSAFVEQVPARTRADITYVSGRTDARITKAVLRIFNLRGDLVRKVDVSDRIDPAGSAVNASWLLENDRGDLVMNGVFIYYWEITFNNGRVDKIRKTLAVARK
ncbi:MAG: hypothetical protein U9P14_02700, partial [Gemmatimonadota bacterium]|nr:hypothetical protein [Gemmatimonadota bacterium]